MEKYYENKTYSCISRRDVLKLGMASAALLTVSNNSLKSSEASLDQWSREAMFYSKEKDVIYCELCPVDCMIRPGKTGDCRTRTNIDGKLYTIAYGNPCSVHVDPVEKKPLHHFLPGTTAFSFATAGCNFACLNCQNWEISQAKPSDLRHYDMMPEKAIGMCEKYKCPSIAYTYTEPTVFYEYMFDTAMLAREKGIKNLMISNGYIYKKPLKKLAKYLDAANVDLKSFDNDIYKKLNRGTLKPILDTLITMQENKVWLEITNLVIPTWTDDLDMIERMCKWLVNNNFDKQPLHFSAFFPAHKLDKVPNTPADILIKAREIALNAGMQYVYIGNVAGTNGDSTYCPKCKELLIEREKFEILTNNLHEGTCNKCGTKINGVWG